MPTAALGLLLACVLVADVSSRSICVQKYNYCGYLLSVKPKCALPYMDVEECAANLPDDHAGCQTFQESNELWDGVQREYKEYVMQETMFTDLSESQVSKLSDIGLRYAGHKAFSASGRGADAVIFPASSSSALRSDDRTPEAGSGRNQLITSDLSYVGGSYCADTKDEDLINRSWLYALKLALDRAYFDAKGKRNAVSLGYLESCLFDGATKNGGHTLGYYLEQVESSGVLLNLDGVERYDPSNGCEYYGDLVDYQFKSRMIDVNKKNLIDALSSGVSVMSIVSLDFEFFRFFNKMKNQPEDYDGTIFPFDDRRKPNLYVHVAGFYQDANDLTKEDVWFIQAAVCDGALMELNLPITSDETGANFAAIAGYAMGVFYRKDGDL